MKRGAWGLMHGGVGVLLASAASAGTSSVDCGSLDVRLQGIAEAAQAKCESGAFGGGDKGKGKSELIQVDGPAAWFVVSHVEAGVRTYVRRQGVKDVLAGQAVFAKTEEWGDSTEIADFEVRRFKATMPGGTSATAQCFGFSLYSGHVPQSTGYRHHLDGFYCDFTGQRPTDGRINELLAAIRYDF
jgi:hypothetical protein